MMYEYYDLLPMMILSLILIRYNLLSEAVVGYI